MNSTALMGLGMLLASKLGTYPSTIHERTAMVYHRGTAIFTTATEKEMRQATGIKRVHMAAAIGSGGDILGEIVYPHGNRVYCLFAGHIDPEGAVVMDECVQ